MLFSILKLLRITHWTKNLLLFAGLVFSLNIFDPVYLSLSLSAFGIFCLISSSGYIINDLFDLTYDKNHTIKSRRPIAAGLIQPGIAGLVSFILAAAGFGWAFYLKINFAYLCLFYYIMTFLYSAKLKHVVILDVLIISAGFVIRAIAGAVIIDVQISKWLLICTIFLALFLALAKRLSELNACESGKNIPRKSLEKYDTNLLTQLISISSSCALIGYTLYTVDDLTISKFETIKLVYTLPFVIYGIFRYLYLIHRKNLGEYPEKVLLTDIPLLINVLLYGITVVYILY
ncbi:decaprenyl-phosphate phosphoribosyltransferase [candidate division KSB1 bacterium]